MLGTENVVKKIFKKKFGRPFIIVRVLQGSGVIVRALRAVKKACGAPWVSISGISFVHFSVNFSISMSFVYFIFFQMYGMYIYHISILAYLCSACSCSYVSQLH
jgi:hypothetical protein